MQPSGLWLRIFVGLLIAVIPPLVLLAAMLRIAEPLLAGADPALTASLVVAGAIVWAGILGVIYARSLGDTFRDLLALARRGAPVDAGEPGAPSERLAALLEERNRQVGALAEQAGMVPIDDDPVHVIRSFVTTTGSIMGDRTWRCAVLATQGDEIPAGVYHGLDDEREVEPIGDLETWASTAEAESPARHVEGPWGAFTVTAVTAGHHWQTTAILYAPWEGRPRPTRSELDLLVLVGRHAGTALQHSLLYARLRSQSDELSRLAAVQADFLRGVTHDLQTPLTSIGALATELRADGSLPPSTHTDLETIAHQADRLRRLVSQLLVASRIEAGVFAPQVEVFHVRPLVERTWAALRSNRSLKLAVAGAPHLAVADPDRLEQVLWAVMDNAVKYSPPDSPIEISIEAGAGEVAITIRDHGAGMDDEARLHAFEQFYRSPSARRMAPDGSGVGLYAARGLIEAMGGSIELDSRLGSGTAVTIRVPAEPSDAE